MLDCLGSDPWALAFKVSALSFELRDSVITKQVGIFWTLGTLLWHIHDQPFHNFGASKSSKLDVPDLHNIRWSHDLEALKLGKGPMGSTSLVHQTSLKRHLIQESTKKSDLLSYFETVFWICKMRKKHHVRMRLNPFPFRENWSSH